MINEQCGIIKTHGKGIPRIKYFGQDESYVYLVMQLLGQSLNACLAQVKKFSLKSTLMAADQMLKRIEFLHSKEIIHRYIKPANFAIGMDGKQKRVFLIDFGLARSTKGIEEGRKCKKGIGTKEYCSINADKGLEQSYRDDLEAIGYVLINFLNGTLPGKLAFTKLGYNKEQRRAKITEMERNISIEDLCSGIPEEFAIYMKYTRDLPFYRTQYTPDQKYLRGIFRNLAKRHGIEYDGKFDWRDDSIKCTNKDSTKMST